MKLSTDKICIYPGRFQPFGPHHYRAYQHLVRLFGINNVYIATSNHTELNSPLNFEEKKEVIRKYNISDNKIILVKNPYKSEEITSKFDENKTSVIFAYGEKDYGRIQFTKKDLTPSYLRPYRGQENLEPLSKCGYVYQIPNVRISGRDISGTWLRRTLPLSNVEEFMNIMGWYDPKIHALFKKKFYPEISEVIRSLTPKKENIKQFKQPTMEEFKEVFQFTKNQSRHICHPYEDPDLTFIQFKDLIDDLCKGGIEASLKVDGRNLKMTYKDGMYRTARNKGTTVNPMTRDVLSNHFEGRGDLQTLFVKAHEDMEEFLQTISKINWNNGTTFVNFEILYAPLPSSIPNEKSQLCIHGLITYDEKGNEINKEPFPNCNPYQASYYEVLNTPKINLNTVTDLDIKYDFWDMLNEIRLDCGLNWSDPIGLIRSSVKRDELELLTHRLANLVIQRNIDKNDKVVNALIAKLSEVEDQLEFEKDPKTLENFQKYSEKLNKLGRLKSINPIEGFVFVWKNGSMYKITGSFAPLNRLLGLFRYKR